MSRIRRPRLFHAWPIVVLALLGAATIQPPVVEGAGRQLGLLHHTAVRVAEPPPQAAEHPRQTPPHLAAPTAASAPSIAPAAPFATFAGDPLLRSSYPRSGMSDTINGSGCQRPCLEPPDPWIAVGPSHVVQVVNRRVRITDRAGASPTTRGFPSLFGEPTEQQGNGDARLVWDKFHLRWIASEMSWDCAAGHLYLAISKTADPTGAWTHYRLDFRGRLMDYPALGISGDKVVLSANQYQLSPFGTCEIGGFLGASLHVFDMAALLAGPSTIDVAETAPGATLFTWRPAVNLSSGNDIQAFVEIVPSSGSLHVGYARVTGTVAGGTVAVIGPTDLTASGAAGAFIDPPLPRQYGGGAALLQVDSRPTDALWRSGSLWTVSSQRCRPAGDSVYRSCVRVIEYRTSEGTVRQDFVMGANGVHDHSGGIGIGSDGRLYVAWSRSSTSLRTSTYVATRGAGDPVDTISKPALLVPGLGPYAGGRWGDYVGVAADPTSAGGVWLADEYPDSAGGWATWVQRLRQQSGTLGGSVLINGAAASTTSGTVTLTLTPSAPSPVVLLRVSNDPTLNGGQLLIGKNYQLRPTISWSLTDPNYGGSGTSGTKFVYVQFGDGAGNWSTVRSDSIIFNPPDSTD
jgi:hypothetical protein